MEGFLKSYANRANMWVLTSEAGFKYECGETTSPPPRRSLAKRREAHQQIKKSLLRRVCDLQEGRANPHQWTLGNNNISEGKDTYAPDVSIYWCSTQLKS